MSEAPLEYREEETRLAFIDFEASGLGGGSWPIEVGWAIGFSRPTSTLIAPDVGWPMTAWDPNAELLHGLSVMRLYAEGAPAHMVCDRLDADLQGLDVYSDAPDYDATWLSALFSCVRRRPKFRICDLRDLFPGDLSRNEFVDMTRRADRVAPHVHRAAADVRHMQAFYELLLERQKIRSGAAGGVRGLEPGLSFAMPNETSLSKGET